MDANSKYNNRLSRRDYVRRIVTLALFSALAYAAMFLFRIQVGFLTFEPKDAIIAVAAMMYGPMSGVTVSLAVTLLEMITVSTTGPYGWIMNFAASATFVVLSSWIYRRKKSMLTAVLGLVAGVVGLVAVMLGLNLVITPLYAKIPVETVIDMIPTMLLPFNLIKGTLNSAIVLMLYKPLGRVLRDARLLPKEKATEGKLKIPVYVVVIAGLALAVLCVAILLFVLDGNITFFKK